MKDQYVMGWSTHNIVIAFVEKYKEVSLGKKEGEIMKEVGLQA